MSGILLQLRRACFASAVFMIIFLMMGCSFTSQIIDRTLFDKPEMEYTVLLPDRDLPDLTNTVVSGGGAGSGGGAVGGCWN